MHINIFIGVQFTGLCPFHLTAATGSSFLWQLSSNVSSGLPKSFLKSPPKNMLPTNFPPGLGIPTISTALAVETPEERGPLRPVRSATVKLTH